MKVQILHTYVMAQQYSNYKFSTKPNSGQWRDLKANLNFGDTMENKWLLSYRYSFRSKNGTGFNKRKKIDE